MMLTARQEAERIGRHESAVSRARRDPTHPANADPRTHTAKVGNRGSVLVPADAIDAWWASRQPGKPGPKPRTTAQPQEQQ